MSILVPAATLAGAGLIQAFALTAIATVLFARIISAEVVACLACGAIAGCVAAIFILAGCLSNAAWTPKIPMLAGQDR